MNDADKQTEKWLQEQVAAGRITQAEYDEIRLGRTRRCEPATEWRECPWDDVTMHYWIAITHAVSVRDLTIYLNYPAWTQKAIAERLGISQRSVRDALARVRRAFPSLAHDTQKAIGLPELRNMVSLDRSDAGKVVGKSPDGETLEGMIEYF